MSGPIWKKTEGVVDIDDFSESQHDKLHFKLNREKAALSGVSVAQVAEMLRTAVAGETVGIVHVDSERQPLEITLQLPRAQRSSIPDLLALRVKTGQGDLIPLSEIGSVTLESEEQPIFHKNLHRVNYVVASMAGRSPIEAVFDLNDTCHITRGFRLLGNFLWSVGSPKTPTFWMYKAQMLCAGQVNRVVCKKCLHSSLDNNHPRTHVSQLKSVIHDNISFITFSVHALLKSVAQTCSYWCFCAVNSDIFYTNGGRPNCSSSNSSNCSTLQKCRNINRCFQ